MNIRFALSMLGRLMMIESVAMVLPLLVSIFYGEDEMTAFLSAIVCSLAVGFGLSRIEPTNRNIKVREGFFIVAFGWVAFSLVGAIPFVVSGAIPNVADAIFETVSGFTTTGASILTDVEAMPKGMLFWRSFTHWVGGMGILVFTLAVLPTLGAGSVQILNAETPGPLKEKVMPKVKDGAVILYLIYIGMTVLEIVLLMICGMDWFDASVHTFGTVGTGGFSSKGLSLGAYNGACQWIVGIFMMLSGANFSLYYLLLRKKWREVLHDEELRFYVKVIFLATVLIVINLMVTGFHTALEPAVRSAFFQVSSIITTTGYATENFDLWPTFSKAVLLLLFFVGGCSGSTGGGVKGVRVLLAFKVVKCAIKKAIHPRAVVQMKLNGRSLTKDTMDRIFGFMVLYVVLLFSGMMVVSLEGVPLLDAFMASATTLGNVGPGFGVVGPMGNFASFHEATKLYLSFLMLAGRLELFTIIVLFFREFWEE